MTKDRFRELVEKYCGNNDTHKKSLDYLNKSSLSLSEILSLLKSKLDECSVQEVNDTTVIELMSMASTVASALIVSNSVHETHEEWAQSLADDFFMTLLATLKKHRDDIQHGPKPILQ